MGIGFRILGFGFRVLETAYRVVGIGFRVLGLGGLGCSDYPTAQSARTRRIVHSLTGIVNGCNPATPANNSIMK